MGLGTTCPLTEGQPLHQPNKSNVSCSRGLETSPGNFPLYPRSKKLLVMFTPEFNIVCLGLESLTLNLRSVSVETITNGH